MHLSRLLTSVTVCVTLFADPNIDWKKSDGGELILHIQANTKRAPVSITPLGDRMAVFWSDSRVPHEVLPTSGSRFALSVWFSCSAERPDAENDSFVSVHAVCSDNHGRDGTTSKVKNAQGIPGSCRGVAGSRECRSEGAAREQAYFAAVGELSKRLFCDGHATIPKLISPNSQAAVFTLFKSLGALQTPRIQPSGDFARSYGTCSDDAGLGKSLPLGDLPIQRLWLRGESCAPICATVMQNFKAVLYYLQGLHTHLADILIHPSPTMLATLASSMSTRSEVRVNKLMFASLGVHSVMVDGIGVAPDEKFISVLVRRRPTDGPGTKPIATFNIGQGDPVFIFYEALPQATLCVRGIPAGATLLVLSKWYYSKDQVRPTEELRRFESRLAENAI
jgi:hypothetical protein